MAFSKPKREGGNSQCAEGPCTARDPEVEGGEVDVRQDCKSVVFILKEKETPQLFFYVKMNLTL